MFHASSLPENPVLILLKELFIKQKHINKTTNDDAIYFVNLKCLYLKNRYTPLPIIAANIEMLE
jgi:hypothetical protein